MRPERRLDADSELWRPDTVWPQALDFIRQRLERVRPWPAQNDPGAVFAQVGLAESVQALERWAGGSDDWQRELVRFCNEHLPMYVRPDRKLSARLRELSEEHTLAATSALPVEAARLVLLHRGILRYFGSVDSRARCQYSRGS